MSAYLVFSAFILMLLWVDLKVLHKNPHVVSVKEATLWSIGWISLGLLFGVGVWFSLGSEKGIEYFTGFLIEKSLSVDNIFVFIMVFNFFHIKQENQHKVLFYGILCAIILRGLAIWAGSTLLAEFHWLIYVFGAFLLFTGLKMLFMAGKESDPQNNPILKFLTKHLNVVPDYQTEKFFIRHEKKLRATPLFIALIAIEISDVIFALDSVPAIFAVTKDPFIVYTSNIFAILGLRSLYFVSAQLMRDLRYLGHGVAIVLLFVGIKMLISNYYHFSGPASLAIIASILAVAVFVSLRRRDTPST